MFSCNDHCCRFSVRLHSDMIWNIASICLWSFDIHRWRKVSTHSLTSCICKRDGEANGTVQWFIDRCVDYKFLHHQVHHFICLHTFYPFNIGLIRFQSIMIRNGGGYFPSPYGSAPFPSPTRNFPVRPALVPSFFNPGPSQGKNTQQSPRPSIEHPQKASAFKIYDLETTKDQSEILRLIFAFAGVPFKDKRLSSEEWERQKVQSPFDQLPILRVNRQFKIYHLDPIVRFLGRELNLHGTGKHEHVIVDIVLDTVRRLQEKIVEQWTTAGSNEETRRQWITDHAATHLNQLEKLYHLFNHHGPFYLGSNVSIADLLVYRAIDALVKIDTKVLDKYPHLKQARRRLEKHPRLSNYFQQESKQTSIAKQKSPHSSRQATKSPAPTNTSHRHRSQDGQKSSHHHHHHHHHRRGHSKEPKATSPKKRASIRSSKSPSVSVTEKQQRASKSPSTPTKDKEQLSVRSSESPSVSIKEKEPTPTIVSKSPTTSTTVQQPTPPPAPAPTVVMMGPAPPPRVVAS